MAAEQLLGGGLPRRAGDPRRASAAPACRDEAGEIVEGAEGVVDADQRQPAPAPSASRCTTAAAAPRAKASATKRWPSVCCAVKGEEQLAAADRARSRSTARRRSRRPRGRRRRHLAADRRARPQPTDSRAKALLQSLARSPPGRRTGDLAVADRLLRLVPLAGDQHRPAGLGGGDRRADRLAAVRHQPVGAVAARLQALLDCREDGAAGPRCAGCPRWRSPGRPARRPPGPSAGACPRRGRRRSRRPPPLCRRPPARAPSAGPRRGRRRCGRSRRRPRTAGRGRPAPSVPAPAAGRRRRRRPPRAAGRGPPPPPSRPAGSTRL